MEIPDFHPKHCLILSPHCDDVPLSIGATLSTAFMAFELRVAIVFSVSRFTADCPGNGPVEEITERRKSEEEAAARSIGYMVQFLGFEEPFVRPGFSSIEDILDPQRISERETVWPEVKSAVHSLIETENTLVLSPLACGEHIDHRIVRSVAISIASELPCQLGFYEDLPYSAYLTETEVRAKVPRLSGAELQPLVIETGLNAKLETLQIYRSQLRAHDFQAIQRYWKQIGGERLWLPTGLLESSVIL